MSNFYSFNKSLDVLDTTSIVDEEYSQEGGLGYENVYDIINKSFDKTDTEIKKKYNPKTHEKKCSNSDTRLNCETGKMLKYFMRAETESYKKALKKNKNADRKKYLHIINKKQNGEYILDIKYLIEFIDQIQFWIGIFIEQLKSCEYLENIDQDVLAKIMRNIVGTMKVDKNPEATRSKIIRARTDAEKEEPQYTQYKDRESAEKKNNESLGSKIVGFFVKDQEKKMAITATLAVVAAGTGTGVMLFFDLNPVTGPICLGITAIIYSVFRVYKLFKFLKYGENKIPKNDFIKNLSIFAFNTGNETDLTFNPFSEPSELTKIKNDIKDKFKDKTEINVTELCFKSVKKACFIDKDKYSPEQQQKIDAELKKKKDKIKWWEGLRKIAQKVSPLDEMKYRKKIVKGIIKRMGDVFNEISLTIDSPKEQIVNINEEPPLPLNVSETEDS